MTKNDAIVACVGLTALAAVSVVKIIFDRKNAKKFDEAKANFRSNHKIGEMVDEASVENELISDAEDKAFAKKLMVQARSDMDNSTTISEYQENCDKFLELYSDLTKGSRDKIKANIIYRKKELEDAEKNAAFNRMQESQKNIMDRHYRHEIDMLNAVRKTVEVFKPDAYTLGKIYRGATELIQNKGEEAPNEG